MTDSNKPLFPESNAIEGATQARKTIDLMHDYVLKSEVEDPVIGIETVAIHKSGKVQVHSGGVRDPRMHLHLAHMWVEDAKRFCKAKGDE